jgi:hemoglobin
MRETMYEYAGGDPAFLRLATAHHARCLADEMLNHPFSHHDGHPQHVERLASYWAEVFGGPPVFTEECGGHSSMLGMHAHMGMPEEMGDRFAACFDAATDDAGLPGDAEFRGALHAYMRWAVDEVMTYDPPESVVPADLAVPRWSWDGLVSGG